MERETGIEPATNGLGSRDSTTELLPLVQRAGSDLSRTMGDSGTGRQFASRVSKACFTGIDVPPLDLSSSG